MFSSWNINHLLYHNVCLSIPITINNERKTIETICKTFFINTADNAVYSKQNTHDRVLDLHNEIPEFDVLKTVINTKK